MIQHLRSPSTPRAAHKNLHVTQPKHLRFPSNVEEHKQQWCGYTGAVMAAVLFTFRCVFRRRHACREGVRPDRPYFNLRRQRGGPGFLHPWRFTSVPEVRWTPTRQLFTMKSSVLAFQQGSRPLRTYGRRKHRRLLHLPVPLQE
jgi:hypothetical protein